MRPVPRSASLGTGFIIDSSGIILTNQHVVAGADEIKVTFTESPDEKPTPGKVIGRDPELDVALIQVKTDRKLVPLPLGDSDVLQVGEYVAAVGNPFGQGHSLTHGIISAKGRISPGVPLATYLQTDAPINPGNSGGPLINLKGEVIGINNAIDARAQGIGFAIPINVVKGIVPELRSKGAISRGYLGVVIGDLNAELARKLALNGELEAPVVMEVEPGGPAYRAGIRPFDVITEFNGKPVRRPADLTTAVTSVAEGHVVPIKVTRADQMLEMKVKVGKRPAQQES
jgi:serine protease Do